MLRNRQNTNDRDNLLWEGKQILFEVLGVPEEATKEDIKQAFEDLHAAALRAGTKVSATVRFARNFLSDDGYREYYRNLVMDCRTEQQRLVRPDQLVEFLKFCELAHLKYWPDPFSSDVYHLRLPGQKEPDFVVAALKAEEKKKHQDAVDSERKEERRYRRDHAGKRFFLRFGYTYVFAFTAVALFAFTLVFGFDETFSRWLHVTDVTEQRDMKRLEKEHHEGLALANDAVSQLEAALNTLQDSVRRELDASLDNNAAIPDELAAVLGKESTVTAAWKNLQDAYGSRRSLETRKLLLEAVTNRIREKSFLKADIETLHEMQTWATGAIPAVNSQKENIDHIRAMLDVERFNRIANRPPKEP